MSRQYAHVQELLLGILAMKKDPCFHRSTHFFLDKARKFAIMKKEILEGKRMR